MKEIAIETTQYLQDNLALAAVIALVVGFLANKTVTHWGKSNIVLYFVVGVLGSFVGQFFVRYIGFREILDQVSGMAIFFDVLIAYCGSFVVAALVHLVKPM
jgi:uncharacterized membrane protein YeaQ/YmgE (transglycosylase-associated protein family)